MASYNLTLNLRILCAPSVWKFHTTQCYLIAVHMIKDAGHSCVTQIFLSQTVSICINVQKVSLQLRQRKDAAKRRFAATSATMLNSNSMLNKNIQVLDHLKLIKNELQQHAKQEHPSSRPSEEEDKHEEEEQELQRFCQSIS